MYKLIRNLHLLLGMSTAGLILVYGISAVQMAHQVAIKPRIVEEQLRLQPGLEARPLAQRLMEQYGYRGDLTEVKGTPTAILLAITRPGTSYAIQYDPLTGQTRVKRRELPFIGLLNRMHHLGGFDHSNAAMNLWGGVLAWVSLALIVLGISGVYMWFRIHRERIAGSILLALNLCASVVLLAMLRSWV